MYNAVASALRSGRKGRWFESTHLDYFLLYIVNVVSVLPKIVGRCFGQ